MILNSASNAWLQKLLEDVKEHCKNGNYTNKTLMFCWEHKNIPYIVARFGLTDHGLNWGMNPDSGVGSQALIGSVSILTCLPQWPCLVLLKQAAQLSSM